MKTKWTLDIIRKEALKYKSRSEFATCDNAAYQAAIRNNHLDEVCGHMEALHCKPHTKETLIQEFEKYITISDLLKHNKSAYNAATRLGILEELSEKFDKNFWRWTNDELRLEALKYKTRREFQIGSQGAYVTAINRKILDEICSHMKRAGDISKAQKDLFEIVKKSFPSAVQLKLRKLKIPNKPHIKGMDIDIFIPELNMGIEFDGTYWHSLPGLKRSHPTWPEEDLKNYHKIKDNFFISRGIKILHVNEMDWKKDKDACVHQCLLFLKS